MNLALARLLQLASPALPVGAYTYSQGLEWAVDAGWIRDEDAALAWIGGLLDYAVGTFDAPLVGAAHRAWSCPNIDEVKRLDATYLATRESAELRSETLQMGYSLRRLLDDVAALERPDGFAACDTLAFPVAWAGVAAANGIGCEDAVIGYLWGWCENQVMAAVKSVPLGQSAGQRMLASLGARLPTIAQRALDVGEDDWHNFAPGFAIACSRHETQYSRLFRS